MASIFMVMREELTESRSGGPARSAVAIAASAVGATLLFWTVGRSLPVGIDLQVAFLLGSFGLILAISVGYSWAIDRVWKRTTEQAQSALASFKGDFVAGLSHELRTSLTGIVGFAQMVDARVVGGDNAEAIHAVVSQSVELSRVVDDLVVRARLDSDSIALECRPVDVTDEVTTAVGLAEVVGSQVSMECEPARVLVDPEAFRHVLRNLLANAVRHGLPPVSVRGRRFGERYICQVVDHGVGLPEGKSPFEAENEARPGAVGLGLTVAKELAERMDCELSYRHLRGETHFVLNLPAVVEPVTKPVALGSAREVPVLKRTRRKEGTIHVH